MIEGTVMALFTPSGNSLGRGFSPPMSLHLLVLLF